MGCLRFKLEERQIRHTWGAVAGAVIGGVVSYAGQRSQNNAQQRAAQGQGAVDMYNTVSPYAGSQEYRNAGAARMHELVFGSTPPPGAAGYGSDHQSTPVDPSAYAPQFTPPSQQARGGQGGGQAQTRVNRRGQTVPVRNPQGGGRAGGGGGGNAPAATPYQGQSTQTAAAIDNASRVAAGMENSATTRAAQDYTAGTLRGEDQNSYRGEAADMVRDIDTSNYDRYIGALFGSDNGLGTGGGGQAVAPARVNYSALNPSGGGGAGGSYTPDELAYINSNGQTGTPPASMRTAEAAGPVGVPTYIKDILDGGDTPYAQAMRDRIKRQADEAYAGALRARRLEASGSNMYGGSGQMADEAYATGKYGAGLADAYAAQDYDTYRLALQLGTGYDTASLDRAAQERMNSANNATASAASGAAAAANDAQIASRERMARLDALGRAVEYGGQFGLARAGAMGGLGDSFSADQRAALGGASDVNAMGQAGYLNAGGLSLGSDNARNNWQASQNSLAASRASTGVARQALALDRDQFAFDVTRWQHDTPMNDVQRYMSIIGGAYDQYNQTHQFGTDRRSGAPALDTGNPYGAAISGAVGGYQLGSAIAGGYGSGSRSNVNDGQGAYGQARPGYGYMGNG